MKLFGGLFLLALAPPAAEWSGDEGIPAVSYPRLADVGSSAGEFVPSGWKLEAQASGDLNADRIADIALVLHKDDPANRLRRWESDPENLYDSNPRILLVAFGRPQGGFLRKVTAHRLITRLEQGNMDDPFDSLEIAKGTLRLKMHAFMSAGGWWMGNYQFTFRWQEGAMRLIGYDRDGVQRNSGETDGLSINYLTGVKLVKSGSIDSEKDKVTRHKISRTRLLTMDDVGSAMEFLVDDE